MMFSDDTYGGSLSLYTARYATPTPRSFISNPSFLLSTPRPYPVPRGEESMYSFPPSRHPPIAVTPVPQGVHERRLPLLPPPHRSTVKPPLNFGNRGGFRFYGPQYSDSPYRTKSNQDLVEGRYFDEDYLFSQSIEDADSLFTDENIYSYAGEEFLPPALVIRAESLLKAAKEAEENVYEEISDLWDNPSLVQRVLERCNVPFEQRKVLSALNIEVGGFKGQRTRYNGTHSPDSGLTMSASDSSGDGTRPLHHSFQTRNHRTKLKRCESLDIKDLGGKRPRIPTHRISLRENVNKGRKNPLQRGFEGVKERMEKTRQRLLKFSKRVFCRYED